MLELGDADWAFLRGVLREYAASKTGQGKLGQVSTELLRFHMRRVIQKQNEMLPDEKQASITAASIDKAIKKEPASTEAEFKDIVYLKKANIQEWAKDSVKNFIEVNFEDVKFSVKSEAAKIYLGQIFGQVPTDDASPASETPEFLKAITSGTKPDLSPIGSGLFQLFRQFKPRPPATRETETEAMQRRRLDQLQHYLVTELVYIDRETLDVTMITCEGFVYRGVYYVNSENNGFIWFSRQHLDGWIFRVLATDVGQRDTVRSGMLFKTGNRTKRAIASHCYLLELKAEEHSELLDAIENLEDVKSIKYSEKFDTIYDYITGIPQVELHPASTDAIPDANPQVVGKIPLLKALAETRVGPVLGEWATNVDPRLTYFREPLRASNRETLADFVVQYKLKAFRRNEQK